MVLHNILPTNDRLYNIHLTDSGLCRTCGGLDTRMHQLTECGEGKEIWDWTRTRIAWMLRTDPARIAQERLLRTQFQIWKPRRHMAVLRFLANMGRFRMQERQAPSAQEYCEFLRRTRWKACQATRRITCGKLLGGFSVKTSCSDR